MFIDLGLEKMNGFELCEHIRKNSPDAFIYALTGYAGLFASPSPNRCNCSRRFPMIKKIDGRQDDFLTLPSGKKISPRMINVIEHNPGIKEYQTIQVSKESFVVKLVKDKQFSEKTVSEIQKQIMIGCLGETVKVEVELVDRIHREKTGKRRAVVSKVK